jgi:uncharacterized protein DUF6065
VEAPEPCFYPLIRGIQQPTRASRTIGGTIPLRAAQYCEPLMEASAFGWHFFSPLRLAFQWTGDQVYWAYDDLAHWFPLRTAQYPNYVEYFNEICPEGCRGQAPFFLASLREPGVVQMWSGYLAKTRPDWSLLIRGPANVPRQEGYEVMEGIIESDWWFGPLFTNIRFVKTDLPIVIETRRPLFQVQPLYRLQYSDQFLRCNVMEGAGDLSASDWEAYRESVSSGKDGSRPGTYATKARKRRQIDPQQ